MEFCTIMILSFRRKCTYIPRSVDTSNNILWIIYISSVFTSRRLLIYLQQFRHHHDGRRFIFFSVEEYIIIKYYSLYAVYCHYTLCIYIYIYRYLCTYYYKYYILLLLLVYTLFSRGDQYALYSILLYTWFAWLTPKVRIFESKQCQ